MGRGKGESKLSPRRVNASQRATEALELRKGGATFGQIAEKLEYKSAASAFKAIDRALAKTMQEAAGQLRCLEAERLDRMFLAIWPKAKGGDLAAIERALGIMNRRAKLLGLDAPTKVAPTDPSGERPYEDPNATARLAELLGLHPTEEQGAGTEAGGEPAGE